MRQRTRSSCRNTHPGRITIVTCRAISSAIAPTGQQGSSTVGHIGAATGAKRRVIQHLGGNVGLRAPVPNPTGGHLRSPVLTTLLGSRAAFRTSAVPQTVCPSLEEATHPRCCGEG